MERSNSTRKLYIDNLRVFTVLLLFPYHTSMIYNNFGESWYIHWADMTIPSTFIRIMSIWMMPLLFAIAGLSSSYALERRSLKEYTVERVKKLLIPLLFGVLLIVPIQPYIAGLYFNGSANYFNSFTKLTDLSGYDGGFTPGHLWFIAYLFVISLVFAPLMSYYKSRGKKLPVDKLPLIALILLGIIPLLTHYILNIGGKSIGEYTAYFLLGYFVLSNENVLAKLDHHRFLLLALMLCAIAETLLTNGVWCEFMSWISILAILGLGRHYINFRGKVPSYLSKSSFGVYLFHQSWIVIIAYFVLKAVNAPTLQILIILPASIALTFLTYEITKRFHATRWMFGLKN